MWQDLSGTINDCQIVRNDIVSIPNHKTDVAKLENHFMERFLTNYKNMSSVNKFFQFGTILLDLPVS